VGFPLDEIPGNPTSRPHQSAVMDNSTGQPVNRIGLSFIRSPGNPGRGILTLLLRAAADSLNSHWPPSRSASMQHSCEFITLRASSLLRFPLLAAIGARLIRIEIAQGVLSTCATRTAVIWAEESAAADLLAGVRLQLGVGPRFARACLARAPRRLVSGGVPRRPWQDCLFSGMQSLVRGCCDDIGGGARRPMLAGQPQSPVLVDRMWWGSGTRESAVGAPTRHEPDDATLLLRVHAGAVRRRNLTDQAVPPGCVAKAGPRAGRASSDPQRDADHL